MAYKVKVRLDKMGFELIILLDFVYTYIEFLLECMNLLLIK